MSALNILLISFLLTSMQVKSQSDTLMYFTPSGKIVQDQRSGFISAHLKTKTPGKSILITRQKRNGKWTETSKSFIIKTNDTTFQVTRMIQNNSEQYTRIANLNSIYGSYLIKDFKKGHLLAIGSSKLIFPEIKDGTWFNYYASGIKASEEYFTDNQMTGNRNWNEKGEEGASNVFQFAQDMPGYPGGLLSMKKFIKANLHPSVEAMNKVQGGIAYVQFIVLEDGTLSNLQIAKSLYPLLDQEALRVVGLMPKWQPGQMNGKNIKVQVTIPVVFSKAQ